MSEQDISVCHLPECPCMLSLETSTQVEITAVSSNAPQHVFFGSTVAPCMNIPKKIQLPR